VIPARTIRSARKLPSTALPTPDGAAWEKYSPRSSRPRLVWLHTG
jgi:hypothetical protein